MYMYLHSYFIIILSFQLTLFVVCRDDGRMITSMPVSPCSSPLRQHGPAQRISYLSPPHPAFAMMGQSSYNLSDFSLYPIRQGPYTHELFFDTPPLKFQTPGTSPRTRPI